MLKTRIPVVIHLLLLASTAVPELLQADPLPDGAYVDFLVVPVGPAPLAEFESISAPTPGTDPEKPAKPESDPTRQGSGVRVKEQDPTEIPPRAVYLSQGKDKYLQIPCFANAIVTPVRTKVKDSDVTFQLRSPGSGDSFTSLDACRLPATGQPILVLLTKPVNDKKWTHPKVTMIPVASSQAAQLVIANASQSLVCGAVIGNSQKVLLNPLKHTLWRPGPSANPKSIPLALAMGSKEQQFLPPFYNNHVTLDKSATTVLISYEVTPQESFRRAKYITGSFTPGVFRPATRYPEEPVKASP